MFFNVLLEYYKRMTFDGNSVVICHCMIAEALTRKEKTSFAGLGENFIFYFEQKCF